LPLQLTASVASLLIFTAAPVGRPVSSTGMTLSVLSTMKAMNRPSGDHTGPSSLRVEMESCCPPGVWNSCSPVVRLTVRIWLVPSRNLDAYTLSAETAIVFPSADQVGRPGPKSSPITRRKSPEITSTVQVSDS
jgi:hypothetical protein